MAKGGYVDGFVLVVPKKKLAEYKKMAAQAGKVWKKHGALDYKECVGEDLHPKGMEMNGEKAWTFPQMAQAKPSEAVVFSYILFKSRKHRDQVNKKVMADPYMNSAEVANMPMPFDMKRFSYGGFQVIVDA